MIVVVADTSGLVAALDETHPDGDAERAVLRDAGTLIVSPVLLSELDHVAGRVLGRAAAYEAIDDIRRWARAGRAVLPEVTADVLDTAQAVRGHYPELKLDLADAVNVASRRSSAPMGVLVTLLSPAAMRRVDVSGLSTRNPGSFRAWSRTRVTSGS